ncbi:MAG TPA: cytochrome b N-terminal domain-containing protein [Gemmatimonadales bacterium]|nr:cytochrome b N-terminal domain-containing protein [Gemmatimonadales bacterium]
MPIAAALQRGTRRVLARADAWMNRLYGWRYNPLYHSGALVVALMLVVLITGVYLLFFYRIGAPFASVARITDQVWFGRWIRGLHRYASDAAVVAVLVHALRLFAQGRSWGPRTLAWVSGLTLLFVVLLCGWTGYVMVWDIQGQVLAQEGARLLDVLPILSEPISRAFVGEHPIPGAFFFLNLFAHIALPIGMGLLVWLHVSRVARPGLLPPRGLMWAVIGLLLGISVFWPVGMAPPADLFALPGRAPFDWFYSFWVPLARPFSSGVVWGAVVVIAGVTLLAPLWTRPAPERRPLPSAVDERLCTGCEQCYEDCPYEAIGMVERADRRPEQSDLVARVDPARCVSCGICAGSCAPMGVGPPRRTGRDQLSAVKAFVAARWPGPGDIVIIACDRGAGGIAARAWFHGAPIYAVACAGSLHTSVIEFVLRAGAGGVLVIACPARDCWNREGGKWLEQRMYHDREAELRDRVDRRRVRLAFAGEAETACVLRELADFRVALAALEAAARESDFDLSRECEKIMGEVSR